ncbi:MAG TPA: aminodeoxychorismate/anthranilate synthase component II [Bacteroidia bacterium]|jgi:anthranilate synthase component 2|nr:aminodeoxychorismate/anthranilate synthase component II [Bacteroidia bacterium]
MKILVFDNYDSFTYNLVHCIEKAGTYEVEVHRNDKISLSEIARFDKILLSPGPGLPSEAGILHELVRTYAPLKDIFGVCLGQQAIAEVFGGSLRNLEDVYHGVATEMEITQKDLLFEGMPSRFKAGRYHSWVVDEAGFPAELEVTARDSKGYIMALRHKTYKVRGVQFHPESILTEEGDRIIRNWLES